MGVKGYKAFSKGLMCNNKQYTENTVFEENGTKICEEGVMHFCENPFDVLNYYPLVNDNGEICEFANVEAIGKLYKSKGDDKCATNKLKIGTKLNLKGFVKACIDFTSEKKPLKTNVFSGDNAQLASSGDYAQLATTGERSVVAAVGINSIAKARVGSWIILAEWENIMDETGHMVLAPKCVKTEYVDGERIKPDVFYKLSDGKFEAIESTESEE